jgi:Zn-dependent protease with chaperone function
VASATPLVVGRVAGARPLTPTERTHVGPPADATVRVLDVRRPNAFAAGLAPGPRVVFVTEGLIDRLPPAAAAAVIAHEVGHHRRHHVALRLSAVGAFVLPWLGATAAGLTGAFPLGCVLAVPYGLGLVRLMRWTEHDADAYAARHADGAALAAGLRILDGGRPRGPVARLLSPHPAPAERAWRVSRGIRR